MNEKEIIKTAGKPVDETEKEDEESTLGVKGPHRYHGPSGDPYPVSATRYICPEGCNYVTRMRQKGQSLSCPLCGSSLIPETHSK